MNILHTWISFALIFHHRPRATFRIDSPPPPPPPPPPSLLPLWAACQPYLLYLLYLLYLDWKDCFSTLLDRYLSDLSTYAPRTRLFCFYSALRFHDSPTLDHDGRDGLDAGLLSCLWPAILDGSVLLASLPSGRHREGRLRSRFAHVSCCACLVGVVVLGHRFRLLPSSARQLCCLQVVEHGSPVGQLPHFWQRCRSALLLLKFHAEKPVNLDRHQLGVLLKASPHSFFFADFAVVNTNHVDAGRAAFGSSSQWAPRLRQLLRPGSGLEEKDDHNVALAHHPHTASGGNPHVLTIIQVVIIISATRTFPFAKEYQHGGQPSQHCNPSREPSTRIDFGADPPHTSISITIVGTWINSRCSGAIQCIPYHHVTSPHSHLFYIVHQKHIRGSWHIKSFLGTFTRRSDLIYLFLRRTGWYQWRAAHLGMHGWSRVERFGWNVAILECSESGYVDVCYPLSKAAYRPW